VTPVAAKYLIWSIEHDAWWAPQERGYTRALTEAGIYDAADAQRIVARANRVQVNECLIPRDCVAVWSSDVFAKELDDAIVERKTGGGGEKR